MKQKSEKSVIGHIEELRRRLFVCIIVFVGISLFAYPLSSRVIGMMKEDLLPGIQLVIVNPLEAVNVNVKMSLLIGFMLSIPALAYESWLFVGPALKKKERLLIAFSIMPLVILFLTGVVFCYKVLMPLTLEFMVGEAYPSAIPMLSLNETFSFVFFMLFATGISFELPLAVIVLAKAGLVDYRMLSSARRYVILALFVIAAVVTPDPTFMSQTLVAVPLVILYEISVQLSRFF
jgi:sec-independent protein translocase protein TatC